MTQSQQLLIVNIGWLIPAIIAFLVLTRRAKLKDNGMYEIVEKRQINKRYVFYNNNFLTRKAFRRIVMSYSTLSCYNFDNVKKQSVKLFERSVSVSLIIPIVTFIVLRDITLAALVTLVSVLYYNLTVDKKIDDMYVEVVKEASLCIQSIRDRYMETGNIALAVLYSDKGKYLEKPITQIYDMLVDPKSHERLQEFSRASPIRILKTLANSCYIINENGDEKNADGGSSFENMLMSLRKEADGEVNRVTKTKIAFKSLATITLVGLLVSPLPDIYLVNQIPGTAVLIQGMYGKIEKLVVILVTAASYYIINIMNKPSVVNQVDKIDFIDRISKNIKVRNFIRTIIPKKYKTRVKLEQLVKGALSSKNVEYIYTTKVVVSITLFFLSIVLMTCFMLTAKSTLWNNYHSLSFIADSNKMTELQWEQIKAVDRDYMTRPEKMGDEETANLVKSKVRGLNALEVQTQAERLSKKWDRYYSITFKWYFVLVAFAFGVLGWFSPELSLMLRKKLVTFEEGEDVLQLQTMMIVLSETKMDVMNALYWLERVSTVHKAPLRYAYHAFPSDPEGTLEKLKYDVNSKDFKRLISKLQIATYNLSLKEAFSDMVYDKTQSMVQREMLQMETLESKKQWAKMLSGASIAVTLIGGCVAPVFILAFSEIIKTFQSF